MPTRLRHLLKAAAILCTLNGVSIAVVWPILIGTGRVPELKTQFVYMLFHLAAEALTASCCLLAGLGLLAGRRWAPRLYFFTSGISLCAGSLAAAFYAFAAAPGKAGMLAALLGSNSLGLALLIGIFRASAPGPAGRDAKLTAIIGGASVYSLINAAGFICERRDGYAAAYVCMLLVLAGFAVWSTVRALGQLERAAPTSSAPGKP